MGDSTQYFCLLTCVPICHLFLLSGKSNSPIMVHCSAGVGRWVGRTINLKSVWILHNLVKSLLLYLLQTVSCAQ